MSGGPAPHPNNGLGAINPHKTLPTKLAGECPAGKTSVLFVAQEWIKR